MRDEHTLRRNDRIIGTLGPHASTFTLAWLATHRDRLHTFIAGGHHLSILIVWDRKGRTSVEHDKVEILALKRIVDGPFR